MHTQQVTSFFVNKIESVTAPAKFAGFRQLALISAQVAPQKFAGLLRKTQGLRSMRCFARPLLARSRSFWRLLAPRKSGHVWLRACDGVSSKSVHWPQQNTARAHGVSRHHTFPREKQFPLRGDREAGPGLPSCI